MELKTVDDLNALKSAGVKESEKWEFKSVWPSTPNVEKTICAFANTAGGMILIGVNYNDTSNQIEGFPGIDKVRGLEERAINIGGNINPRVVPASRLIDVASGRVVQVIQVLKSHMIPHMASNYIYYQRVDKENVPLPESLIEKLYLARQVRYKEADAFLKEKEYFKLPGDPHWLSICFCPLYLEPDLISHSRSNLYFLNSLKDIISMPVPFGSIPEGYRSEIRQSPKIGKAVYAYLVEVLNNGVVVFGKWIEDDEPHWEEVQAWLINTISFYGKLQGQFRYPGWTRIVLLLTNMRNTKMKFPDSRMNALLKLMIQGDLLIQMNIEDSRIVRDDPMKTIEPIFTKIKVNYGLDDYIS